MADTVNVHTKRGNREACYNARDVFYACLGEALVSSSGDSCLCAHSY